MDYFCFGRLCWSLPPRSSPFSVGLGRESMTAPDTPAIELNCCVFSIVCSIVLSYDHKELPRTEVVFPCFLFSFLFFSIQGILIAILVHLGSQRSGLGSRTPLYTILSLLGKQEAAVWDCFSPLTSPNHVSEWALSVSRNCCCFRHLLSALRESISSGLATDDAADRGQGC